MQISLSVCEDCISLSFPFFRKQNCSRRRNFKFAEYLLCAWSFINIFLLYSPNTSVGMFIVSTPFYREGTRTQRGYTQHSDRSWVQPHLWRTDPRALKGFLQCTWGSPWAQPGLTLACAITPVSTRWSRKHFNEHRIILPQARWLSFISPTSPWEEAIELIELRAL